MTTDKPANSIHPERIDLSQLNREQLAELRDAVAARLAGEGGPPFFQPMPSSIYGEPTASFAYGQPAPSFAYGEPTASFAYGQPAPSFAYGEPTASFAYGQPAASFAYGQPSASFAYGQPSATFAYGEARPGFMTTPARPAGTDPAAMTVAQPISFAPYPMSLSRDAQELWGLSLQRLDSSIRTASRGSRRVAAGAVAGAAGVACAILFAAGPQGIALVSLLAASLFHIWFLVEMVRGEEAA